VDKQAVTGQRPRPPRAAGRELVSIGESIAEVTVSLRFFGDNLDPDEVSRALECRPTQAFRKGEPLPDRYPRTASTGSWRLEGADDGVHDLEAAIAALLKRVSSDVSVWKGLTSHLSADIFCGLFLVGDNRECCLSASVISELASRNLSIGFDIYTE
jgi:hypothetical protein